MHCSEFRPDANGNVTKGLNLNAWEESDTNTTTTIPPGKLLCILFNIYYNTV